MPPVSLVLSLPALLAFQPPVETPLPVEARPSAEEAYALQRAGDPTRALQATECALLVAPESNALLRLKLDLLTATGALEQGRP